MAIVTLFMKHDDRVSMSLNDAEMNSDYIPHVNKVLGGDDTTLEIDNETGQIIGWTPIKTDGKKFVTI